MALMQTVLNELNTTGDVVRASERVGRLLLFGRFFVVFGVFEIIYTRYFRTTRLLLSSG